MEHKALLNDWQNRQGQAVGTSPWLCVEQARIDAFAEATLDYQAIHVDPSSEAATNIGGPIAHGYLTLSLLSYLIESLIKPYYDNRTVLNYGLNRVRFLNPVNAGSNIRLHCAVKCVDEKPNGILITLNNTIEIEGQDKPALMAEKLILLLNN